jgi:hypothetical protein
MRTFTTAFEREGKGARAGAVAGEWAIPRAFVLEAPALVREPVRAETGAAWFAEDGRTLVAVTGTVFVMNRSTMLVTGSGAGVAIRTASWA